MVTILYDIHNKSNEQSAVRRVTGRFPVSCMLQDSE